jgi:hypothetical protein
MFVYNNQVCISDACLYCRNVPYRVRVRLARKRNDDEDSVHRLYTLVTYVPCTTFKGKKLLIYQSCLNFFHLLARKPNLENCSFYFKSKFFHDFHLSESSFTCHGLRASRLAWRLIYMEGLSLSYGSWIYSYLCKSVPITTNVVSSNSTLGRCTQYNIMWSNLSVTWCRLVVFAWKFCFLHQ